MSFDTIWYTRCPVPTAFSIAVRLGWLDDEFAGDGIAVRSIAVSTDPTVRQAHFDQSLGSFFRHGGNIPPIVSRSRGTDVRLIGLSWTDTAELVLALPESGIASAGDLRGRRLAVPRRVNDGVDFWRATVVRAWDNALGLVGLTTDDVELVEVEVGRTFVGDATARTTERATLWDASFMLTFQREEAAALVRGEVDAIFSHGASAALLPGLLGAHTIVDLGALEDRALRVNNSVPLALTVTGDLLDARPEHVARVVAQTLRAAEWAREHPADAARIAAGEVGLAEELLPVAYSPRVADQLAVDLGPENLAGLESQIALLADHGFLAGPVDIDAFVAHEPLAAARELLAAEARAGV
jgi:ABC-type nitrate/sulfonate/bicarbonate transport system substrate-binding protein